MELQCCVWVGDGGQPLLGAVFVSQQIGKSDCCACGQPKYIEHAEWQPARSSPLRTSLHSSLAACLA
jgi:hypothetical protein